MPRRKLDLESVLKEIERRKAKKIGIQLPDGLKYKSEQIAEFFESKGYEVIISGSHCYGACDLDLDLLKEVDVLLHLAHTPIFELENVIYVPYYVDYDVEDFEDVEIEEKKIALIASAQYAWKLQEVKKFLEERGYEVELKRGSNRVKMPGQVLGCNYTVLRNSKADAVLFVGDGLFHPIGAKIYSGKRVYRFCPLDKEFEEVKVEDFLKKRYLSISKALNAEKGAIIVSRKIGQKRLNLALNLKRKAKDRGKDVEVIYLDDISPQVLENFLYGYYVNTACPRISYDDIELYSVPILTPQEFEIMLGLRDWENYEVDEIP
ncbi:diphthamide biosynthesis enzyme Dph2 [Archaeoglobus sp.]